MTAERRGPSRSKQAGTASFGFEPADIVNEVMSFGSPTPIEVAVSGPEFPTAGPSRPRSASSSRKVPTLRDLQYVQALIIRRSRCRVDGERAGLSGVTTADVARSLVAATSSSRFVVPNYWRDPKNGVGYQVQVEMPHARHGFRQGRRHGADPASGPGQQLLVRDVANVVEGTMPGEYDRYNMRRVVSMTANIEGEDLGPWPSRVARAIRGRRAAARRHGRYPRADRCRWSKCSRAWRSAW